jgi:hypoxanthine phosphoribosyltransferase
VEFRYFRGKQPPRFAHESEREMAEILDAAGLPWDYEPHTFPLEHGADGRLLEAVTPDFYLPDADIYIECTEMKPSLATRKRRKLRKLRSLYGEVVTLVGRREFAALRAKYGQPRRSR